MKINEKLGLLFSIFGLNITLYNLTKLNAFGMESVSPFAFFIPLGMVVVGVMVLFANNLGQ